MSSARGPASGAATAGGATLEIEARDSLTGERLGAAVDARTSANTLSVRRSYQTRAEVEAGIDYWAKRTAWDLWRHGVQLRPGATPPDEPQARQLP